MYTFNFAPVFENFDQLLIGAVLTMQLTVGGIVFGSLIAVPVAAAKIYGAAPLRWLASAYIEAIRNTPFLIQIFFVYFALPSVGLRLDPNSAALVALSVNVGAYSAEIVRAGLLAINPGQIEAGKALGLGGFQVFRYVIFKPAIRAIYPALTSQFVYLMLTSSVVSVISATDLAAAGNNIQLNTFAAFEVYLVVTAIYFALSLFLSFIFSVFGRWAFNYPMAR
ncbi:amino acid ABC transporter permease [Tianweitania sp.]|uniref:amino acid ABC transporter permease n=1 Tax=Tianweitania sp. TaxID=2021634 RepID=UPI0028A11602|nr:amino acid ABC transporter permease [Tianweitania sp.]